MEEVAYIQKRIMFRAASIALILAAFAEFFGRRPEALSVMAGCLLAILNFRLLALGIVGILDLDAPRKAQVQAVMRYMVRYAMMIGFLYLASINSSLNLLAAAVGLLLVKVAILGEVILNYIKQWIQDRLNPARWERGER